MKRYWGCNRDPVMTSSGNTRHIRLGMVGGGQGAFIGAVHRMAARLDDSYELCAGALSSDPSRARVSAREIGLPDDRSYAGYKEMAAAEAKRDDGIEAVSIVTPNHTHFAIARAFLQAGIHVICDKPMTTTIAEAEELQKIADDAGRILAVTYNYSGYPLIREAREMIRRGDLGTIRVVQCQYAQDWLSEPIEAGGQKQAAWRTDPAKSGAGGCVGDIGTHAYHLACFVSGLDVKSLCADLNAFVSGRQLDDNAHLLLRFHGGARGMLWASQVAVGNENNLALRIYGDKGGLSWRQEEPNQLWFTPLNEAPRSITRGSPGATEAAVTARIPAGHPEGYLEAFATLYQDIAAVRSSEAGAAWVEL
jgi:predicted dehydrogenase